MDEEVEYVLERLQGDVTKRCRMLHVLADHPLADERVIASLRLLLRDTTPCVVSRPYRFGEVRYLASRTLAWTLSELGRPARVSVDTIPPMSTTELMTVARASGVSTAGHGGGMEGVLRTFRVLQEAGHLPTRRYDYDPEGGGAGWQRARKGQ